MQRFTAHLVLAITLLAGFVDRIAVAESELFADEPLSETGVVIRGQSPSPRLPPPQLIAQTLTPQPDAYLSSPVVGPSSAVCLPAMDPYVNCPPQTVCPWQTSQFGFFGEFLYLKPR